MEHIPVINNTDITELYLNDNLITQIGDNSFINLKNLTYLNLRNNKINKINNYSFEGLLNLKVLDIYQEETYLISIEAFKPLVSLESLKLGKICKGVSCKSATRIFKHLQKGLKYLEVTVPGHEFVFDDDFSHLHNLQKLTIFGHGCTLNEITNVTFSAFSGSLQTLHIRDCFVTSVANNSFASFDKLQTINLACNRNLSLSGIFESIWKMPSATIQTLIVDGVHSGSVFNKLKAKWFKSTKFKNLKRLSLRQTYLVSIDLDSIYHIPKLEYLNVGYNTILTADYKNITEFLIFVDKMNMTSIDMSYFGRSLGIGNDFRDKYCRSAQLDSDDFFRKSPSHVVIPHPVPCCNHTFEMGSSLGQTLAHNIPQSLLFVHLPFAGFPNVQIKQASFNDDNNILFLDFSGVRIKKAYGPVHGLSRVQGIDVSGCNMDYISASLLPD